MITFPINKILPDKSKLQKKLYFKKEHELAKLDKVFADAVFYLQPKYAFKFFNIRDFSKKEDEAFVKMISSSQDMLKLLEHSEVAMSVICTLGNKYYSYMDELGAAGDVAAQIIFDRFASDTVENLAVQSADLLLDKYYGKKEYEITKRFAPGYGDFDLKNQKQLFSFFSDLDVELTESLIMKPEKSISFIAGVFKK
jgi:hypothetical protein